MECHVPAQGLHPAHHARDVSGSRVPPPQLVNVARTDTHSRVMTYTRACTRTEIHTRAHRYSDIKTAMDKTAPALVVFTTFPLMADCQALCRQHKPYPIPFVLCHTVPASPTREFAPTTAGVGRSLPFGFLNKFAWLAGEKMVGGMYIVGRTLCGQCMTERRYW